MASFRDIKNRRSANSLISKQSLLPEILRGRCRRLCGFSAERARFQFGLCHRSASNGRSQHEQQEKQHGHQAHTQNQPFPVFHGDGIARMHGHFCSRKQEQINANSGKNFLQDIGIRHPSAPPHSTSSGAVVSDSTLQWHILAAASNCRTTYNSRIPCSRKYLFRSCLEN